MAVNLQWLGHASFCISSGSNVVYIDPWKMENNPHNATAVLVSHSHYDHYSPSDISKVSVKTTTLIGTKDVINGKQSTAAQASVLLPGQVITVGTIKITGVPAYNPNKQFHPKDNNWLGFVVELDSMRIYYAGDTDMIEQIKMLRNIDTALLPVGGTYTMDAQQAAEATEYIKPTLAVPYHWGDIVGSQQDAEKFCELAACNAKILQPGETIELK